MANEMVAAWEHEIKSVKEMASLAAQSPFFKSLGGAGGVFSIMMYARALGLDPWQCIFGGMQCIQGRVEVAPVMLNALMRKAGHRIDVVESTDRVCILKGTRGDSGETVTVGFSIDDAKRAKIYKGAWETYPSDMCWARALSRLCRRLCPDVVGPSYTEGEIPVAEQCDDIPVPAEKTPEQAIEKATLVIEPLTYDEINELADEIRARVSLEQDHELSDYLRDSQPLFIKNNIDPRSVLDRISQSPTAFIDSYSGWLKKRTESPAA